MRLQTETLLRPDTAGSTVREPVVAPSLGVCFSHPDNGAVSTVHDVPCALPQVVRDATRIRALGPLLQVADKEWGTQGLVDHLEYFLSPCCLGSRVPVLVIFRDPRGNITGAVLLHEYRIGGVGSRVLIPGDLDGRRNVIAPAHLRHYYAQKAAEVLMDRAALAVIVSVNRMGCEDEFRLTGSSQRPYARRTRTIHRALELRSTYNETLMLFGRSVRRSFRLRVRQLERDLAPQLIDNPAISEEEFVDLSQHCAFPVPTEAARWRYRVALQLPNTMLLGLRSGDGKLLSVAWGRRVGAVTEVDWQINSAAFPRYSIVTAMRAYLMEHEINRGTKLLRFPGGTRHWMHLSFVPEQVSDLIMVRNRISALLLSKVYPTIFGDQNLLGAWLRSGALEWCPPGHCNDHASGAPSETSADEETAGTQGSAQIAPMKP